MKLYTEAFKTLHNITKPYTKTIHETLHKNYTRKPAPQPYFLFLNANLTSEHELKFEREWYERYERDGHRGVTRSSPHG